MKKITFLLLSLAFLSSGCATAYFPMNKQSYFDTEKAKPKTILVMPFDVGAQTIFSKSNTRELLDKKSKEAIGYVTDSLEEEFNDENYKVIDYIPFSETEKKEFDRDQLKILVELVQELQSAKHDISKNMKDDKGKPLDYSIGIRAEELAKIRSQKPDLLLFVYVAGYIENLAPYEANLFTTANALATVGLSLLFPTVNDTIFLEVTLVDAKTGDVVWLNNLFYPSQSLTMKSNIRSVIKDIFRKLPSKLDIKNGLAVKK